MSPITHLLASWMIAAKTTDNPRDCRLVALGGLLPDLDGVGMAVDLVRFWAGQGDQFVCYQKYHHFVGHGLPAALVISGVLGMFARRRLRVALLVLVTFHLHLLCDLVGSRGPNATDIWPIHYLGPLSLKWTWLWSAQWQLDAWPNRIITLALFAACLALAVQRGDSVVAVFNRRADTVFTGVLRNWWSQLANRKTAEAKP